MTILSSRRIALAFASITGLTCWRVIAQESPPRQTASADSAVAIEALQRNTYGTQDSIIHQIPSAAFQLLLGTSITGPVRGYIQAEKGTFVAPLVLPNGSLVNFLDLYYFDTDPVSDLIVDLYAYSTSGVESFVAGVNSSGSGGYGYAFNLISPPLQIDNNNRYMIYVENANYGTEYRALGGVNVWYRLQMSPAPATATFGDVPKNFLYFRAIEALAAAGITSGCGGGNFCPNQPVTRGEMAKFLATALGLHWPY